MTSRRLNQSQLAAYLGIRSSAVNRWFHHASIPNTATCQALARVLKLPLEEVLRAAGHLPPLELGEIAEESSDGYQLFELPESLIALARALHAAGGDDAIDDWEDLGRSTLRSYQKRLTLSSGLVAREVSDLPPARPGPTRE